MLTVNSVNFEELTFYQEPNLRKLQFGSNKSWMFT